MPMNNEDINLLVLMISWSSPDSRASSTLSLANAFHVRLSLLLTAQSQTKRVMV
jgi:hypothetical protein